MNVKSAIMPHELLLAQLASEKLAMLLKGLMSVGVSSLQLDSPGHFLAGQDQRLLAFIEVLRCVGVRPDHPEVFDRLREVGDRLSDLARQFHHHFLELADWRALSPPEVRATAGRLVASYTELCQALATFRGLIGVKAEEVGQVQLGRELISSFLSDCLPLPQDSKASG